MKKIENKRTKLSPKAKQIKRKLLLKKYGRAINDFESYTKETFQSILNQRKTKEQVIVDDLYNTLQSGAFLSSRLNYGDYDEKNGVYINDDSFGFCYSCTPINGVNEEFANKMMGLFSLRWKIGATLSFCLYSSKELKEFSDWVVNSRSKAINPICSEIAKNRMSYYEKGINKPLIKGEKGLVRDYRLIVSVTFDGVLEPEMQAELEMFKNSMMSSLKNLNLNPSEIKPDGLINILDELINRKSEFKDTYYTYNPYTKIKNQITGPDTKVFIDKDGIAINNTIIRGQTVKAYPTKFALGQSLHLIGDMFEDNAQITTPFMFVTNIWIPDVTSLKQVINVKSTRAIQVSEQPIAKWVPEYVRKAADWREVTKILADGQGLCYVNQSFFTFSECGTSDSDEQNLADLFRSKGWELAPLAFIQQPMFFACLPMQFDNTKYGLLKKLGLIRLMPQWCIVNTCLLMGEWCGNGGESGLVLLGRRGQVINLDIFKSDGNYNVAIAADSGSGKSFFMNDLIVTYLGLNAQVFIIDVGRSYFKLCETLGGQYIAFEKNNTLCLNPFTDVAKAGDGEDFNDDLDMIAGLVCSAISPKDSLPNLECAFVSQAVRHVWETHGNSAGFNEVYEWLIRQQDRRVRDLGIQLKPYANGGSYGSYFNGVANIEFKNQFIVLELEELNQRPNLRSVVLALLMFRISQEMYLGDKSIKKICGIDEAWDLMGNGESSLKFIATGYRRARKYKGSFITITQKIQDFYANDGATACLTNSEWVFMLKQAPESIDQLEKDSKLSLNEFQMKVIKSVKTTAGLYSEVFIKGGKVSAVARLIVDPYTNLLYTTEPNDVAMISRFREVGFNIHEAINHTLELKELRKTMTYVPIDDFISQKLQLTPPVNLTELN